MELTRAHGCGVVVERVDAPVCARIPQPNRLVVARREDQTVVGGELGVADPVGVARQRLWKGGCFKRSPGRCNLAIRHRLSAWARHTCAGIDHTLTDLSSEEVTSCWPSEEKATLRTGPVCALMAVDSPLTLGTQRRMLRSLEPEATRWPVGDTATDMTGAV
eukprot:scaffold6417_cov95-Isochrysis_galbana.AAC.1